MKKIFCYIICAVMICSLSSGCITDAMPNDETNNPTSTPCLVGNIPVSFPLTSDEQTLKIMITGYDGVDQENVYVWKKYEEMTGVDVEWDTVSKSTRSEAVHTALTNNQQYDLIMRCKLSSTRLTTYGNAGLILDLAKDDLLKKNAPNCWAYLQSHPDTLASVMNPDGTIYALPQVNSGAELRVGVKIFVNKKWLERVNMDLPTTTDEFREMLVAFKEQDANGNGDPNDEIPLCSVDWSNLQYALYGSFGLGNRGMHNMSVDCDPVTDGARFIEGSDEYRDFLEYLNGLYTDGLLDNQMFTMTNEQWKSNISNDKVGVFPMTNLALIPSDKTDDWVAIDQALTGPNGDKMWTGIRANFHSTGAALIPSTCSNPELVLQWLDYFWTDEGTLFYHMGVEGETYTVLEDGTYDYLPKIYNEMSENNLPYDDVIANYSPYPGGSNPTVEIAPYFMGGEMADVPAEAARALINYGPKEYWPSFTFTEDENIALDAIRGDMNKYCENMRIDFITGARSFDEWDKYPAQLDALGKDEMLSIYQAAIDRYYKLIASLK